MNNEMTLGRDGLAESCAALIAAPCHPVSALANAAALIYEALPRLNWAGFYLLHEGALWLGPFQGKVACTRIEPGKGVCGTALAEDRTLVVPDVHAFPGHIACDSASASEIVIPLHKNGRAVGVLDIDSPDTDRFSPEDRAALEAVAAAIEGAVDLAGCGFSL
ncbi:MAG: GAF domain-containing protein [Oscillospiraceae bacterium]|jgi:GAF domain-containing protein|nr:GAF domain-containing protein [Oscillospiraceae bacterium]